MFLNLFKSIYNYIYKEVESSFLKINKFEIKKTVYIGKTLIKTVNIEIITKIIIKLIKIEKESYETFYKNSQNVDDFLINLNILISFETKEQFRAVEKPLAKNEFKINQHNYKETEILISKSLTLLFEEYSIDNIECVIVKLF